ncbi:MAG: glutathione peroxidase [Tenericutes bacterium HGW-Tenericutes-2]|jgi:glutathione peroxidase|nr:MAG: glutathione peroxidase [Tenericutes bacterium HGW-Tenericutes-2]
MSVYQFSVQTVDQKEMSLSEYKGKVLLIVNTATKCGLTPQYEGLEKLYETYKDKGFEVLDFPCNQFMGQAPGTNEELASFCQLKFGTQFKTFAKINVNGKGAHDLYKYMREVKKVDFQESATQDTKSKSTTIKWNFTKFLVDREGNVIYRFGPKFLPKDISKYIEGAL